MHHNPTVLYHLCHEHAFGQVKNNIAKLTRQTHEVQVPPLCPQTNNPINGSTLTITYAPGEDLLEVYSLNECVAAFVGSQAVRDLELFTQVVARNRHMALGVDVKVMGKFIMNIRQTLTCECES